MKTTTTILLCLAVLGAMAADAAASKNEGNLHDLSPAARFAISASLGRETADYHAVAAAGGGFSVANRAQRYSTLVTSDGFTVTAGTTRWGLQLVAWGCDRRIAPLPAAVPRARANRVELGRGPVLEWYENGPLGLQQGFTVERAPHGCGPDDALRLVLAPLGDSALSVERGGRGLLVGSVLRYGDLAAFEAGGREVPVHLALEDGRVVLQVAAGAAYPLIVDPFVQLAKLTAAGGTAGALFGSTAVSGNTVVVGEYFTGKGAAYVFVEPPGGWSGARTETAKLIASDGAIGDQYGLQVAIHGDTVLVSAGRKSFGGQQQRGMVYVFVRPPGGWSGTLTEQARLIASDGAAYHAFGQGLAIEGDTVVIGQYGWNSGALYVFQKPGGGWTGTITQVAKLVRSDAIPGRGSDSFGSWIGLSGDTVVSGASTLTVGSNPVQGMAYVFVRPAGGWSGTIVERARLTSSDGRAYDRFGGSGDVAADTIVVSAPAKTIGANQYQGAIYVFVRPAGGWAGALTENARLLTSDGAYSQSLGGPVRIVRDTIVAGAVGDKSYQGAVYEFRKPPGGWAGTLTETSKIVAPDGAPGDQFGTVAFADGTLVVGAMYDDVGPNRDQGSAYVFRLCCSCPP